MKNERRITLRRDVARRYTSRPDGNNETCYTASFSELDYHVTDRGLLVLGKAHLQRLTTSPGGSTTVDWEVTTGDRHVVFQSDSGIDPEYRYRLISSGLNSGILIDEELINSYFESVEEDLERIFAQVTGLITEPAAERKTA